MDGPFLLVVLFAFGLAFGSFANVVIWRLPRNESLSVPASHCPRCDMPIRWSDNVPVLSWVLLRGRCRSCGVRISPRYPLVEILVALLWVSCGLEFGSSGRTVVAAALVYLLVILSAIDLDTRRLPNPLVGMLAAAGYAAVLVAEFSTFDLAPLVPQGTLSGSPMAAAVIGSIAGGGVSLAIALAYRGVRGKSGFGMGDVKLLLALGPYLGIYNFGVLFLGSVLGAVAGVILAARSRDGLGASMPFGPFLAAAALILLFFGPDIWLWYAGIVGIA